MHKWLSEEVEFREIYSCYKKENYLTPENIICTVKNQRKVEYQGEDYYLSGLTQKLMNTDSKIRGSKYWYHKGRNLVEIYNATYAKD